MFAAGHGEAGNDLPLFLSSTHGRARRRRLGDHRPQDLRQPVAGVGLPRHPRHGHERPRPARRSCTRFLPRDARATASRRRGTRSACGPPRATTRSSTARSSPTSTSRSCARPASPAPARSMSACSPGALLGFAAVYTAIAQRAYDITVETIAQEDVDRAHPLDGVPPRGAARRRRDADQARDDRRSAAHGPVDWANGVEHGTNGR